MAALRAAIFELFSKNLRGGGASKRPPPPGAARVKMHVRHWLSPGEGDTGAVTPPGATFVPANLSTNFGSDYY